jgi:hypothetical protein
MRQSLEHLYGNICLCMTLQGFVDNHGAATTAAQRGAPHCCGSAVLLSASTRSSRCSCSAL